MAATQSTDFLDVFISYSHHNQDIAERIERALTQRGLRVWRDDRLDEQAGFRFADEIGLQIRRARRVVVLWSTRSVTSTWVQAEAQRALAAGKLVPLRIEPCELPLPHDVLHAVELPGGGSDADLDRLAARIRAPAAAPDVLSEYRETLRAELDRIPPIFRGGASQLPDAFVDVRCDLEVDGESIATGVRPLDVLDRLPGRFTLLGDPGSGKSTLLRHLALELLDEGSRIPVFVRLPELGPGVTIRRALATRFPDEAETLRDAFGRGQAVLLLDGYDEHPDRQVAQRIVARLATEAGLSRVLLSSRVVGFDPPTPEFATTLRLRGLDREAQEALLGRWVDDPERVRHTLDALLRRRRLRSIVDNPLLLTLVGLVMQQTGNVPTRRPELFRFAVECLLRGAHREDGRGYDAPVAATEALGEVALAVHGQDDAVPLEVLCRVWPAARWRERLGTSPEPFFDTIARVTGLLQPVGSPFDLRYAFPHRSLREYLAASALANRLQQGDTMGFESVLDKASERPAAWAEVLALACGRLGADDADALVARIAERGHHGLVRRVVAEAEDLSTPTVFSALGVQTGAAAWPARRDVLLDLPDLLGEAQVEVDLLDQLSRRTSHGADRWWIHALLSAMAIGEAGSPPAPPEARAEAGALAERMIRTYRPKAREWVLAELESWFRGVPPGLFRMGSPPDERGRQDWEVQHDVHVVNGFEMLAVPVTHAWYEAFDPHHAVERHDFRGIGKADQDRHPVYRVTWFEAAAFAAWLGLRLPTEVEWEYACRGDMRTRYWSGHFAADLVPVAWTSADSEGRTHEVATKPANRFGMHDTLGNVWEWCADAWDEDTYTERLDRGPYAYDPFDPPHDDTLDDGERMRVLRGGSWVNAPWDARCAVRKPVDPGERTRVVGFRLVRAARPKSTR